MTAKTARGSGRVVVSIVALVAVVFAAAPAQARATHSEEVDPDADDLHIAASVYWGVQARYLFNWGLHGQVTYAVAPFLELQGSGRLNLPGSGVSLVRGEGSAFLAIPWLGTADVVLSSYTSGNYTHTRYVPRRGGSRKKIGVEGGVFLDRHEAHYYSAPDLREKVEPIAVTSLGVFGGIKYIRQTHVVLANGAVSIDRWGFYVHAIQALKQGITPPAGETDDKAARWGGRLGFEFGLNGETSMFTKWEFGLFPSTNKPDAYTMMTLGVKHSRSLF